MCGQQNWKNQQILNSGRRMCKWGINKGLNQNEGLQNTRVKSCKLLDLSLQGRAQTKNGEAIKYTSGVMEVLRSVL